jgi:hypothetical protein
MFALLTFFCCIARATFWGTRTSAWDEIESVVASGKEVTIHEAPISAHGFTGSGYTVVDPQTGAGGYLIEGGARGAIAFLLGIGAAATITSLLVGASSIVATGGLATAAVAAILIMLLPILTVYVLSIKQFILTGTEQDRIVKAKCFVGGLGYGLAAQGMLAGLGATSIAIKGAVSNAVMGILGFAGASLGGDSPSQCLAGIDLFDKLKD